MSNYLIKKHICNTDNIPCDKAIETPDGFILCPYTGRKFGLLFLNHHNNAISSSDDEEDLEEEQTPLEEEEEEIIHKEKTKECILFTLTQLIDEGKHQFPFDAYVDELMRLYKEYEMTAPLAEFTIATLFIMAEGNFGELCNQANTYLNTSLISRSNLKDVGLQKHLITSGKTKWCEKLGNEAEDDDDDEAFTSFSRRKKQLRVTIRGHAEIMDAYNKIHEKDNEFLFVL